MGGQGSPRGCPRSGRLVTESLDFDGGRQVSVYVPPEAPEAVVFAADGQRVSRWGVHLEAADVPPTMVVGVHGLSDETLRLHEYSPGFDADRFAAHETFFVDDVTRWVASTFGVALPPDRTAVFGASAGGELALALGLRHPDTYGAILAGSPGAGYQPPEMLPDRIPHLPRRRDAGAVLPRQRCSMGGRAAPCGCGGRDERAAGRARRPAVAIRVPAHGGLGLRRDHSALAPFSTQEAW